MSSDQVDRDGGGNNPDEIVVSHEDDGNGKLDGGIIDDNTGSTLYHIWSKSFGSEADEGFRAAVVYSDNNIYLTGAFWLSVFNSYSKEVEEIVVDFSGGPLSNAGNSDIFLVKLGQ